MKEFWKEVRLAGLMGLVVPGVLLGLAVSLCDGVAPEESTQPPETERTLAEAGGQEIPILMEDGSLVQMDLDDYLTGVILAEMPVSFEPEAQKAQAVVARTYTVRAWKRGGKHEGAAVCTDSACCQGYILPEDYLSAGGTQEGIEKMRSAVEHTSNLVLTYEGELIEATYFSCSGGSTEDAVAVWGTEVPYLQAVPSPGEENAAHYSDTVVFAKDEFADVLGISLTGDHKSWFGSVTYTSGGGVNTMEIGGVSFSGTELRKLLNLRSTAFTVTTSENQITITTRGFGHRVGMSQYGADAMAALGSDFEQILSHYYQGTELTQWFD